VASKGKAAGSTQQQAARQAGPALVGKGLTVGAFVQWPASGKLQPNTLYTKGGQLYRTRYNGTVRHIAVPVAGTPQYKQAQTAATLRTKGHTVAQIAAQLHTSVPTVRRLLTGWQLAQQVASGAKPKGTPRKPRAPKVAVAAPVTPAAVATPASVAAVVAAPSSTPAS
jgi:hypothetical protein